MTKKSKNAKNDNKQIKAKKAKNLNLTELKRLDKQYKQEDVVIVSPKDPDVEYKFKIDTVFRNTKIIDFISELQEKINLCSQHNISINDTVISLFPVLLLKHFTSLKIPSDIEKQIELSKGLINHEFLGPILEAFPESQLNIISEKIKEVSKNMNEYTEMLADEVLKDDFQLENEDVLQMKDWAKGIKGTKDEDKFIN